LKEIKCGMSSLLEEHMQWECCKQVFT